MVSNDWCGKLHCPKGFELQNRLFACLDLYHTSPDFGERHSKSRTGRKGFDPVLRAGLRRRGPSLSLSLFLSHSLPLSLSLSLSVSRPLVLSRSERRGLVPAAIQIVKKRHNTEWVWKISPPTFWWVLKHWTSWPGFLTMSITFSAVSSGSRKPALFPFYLSPPLSRSERRDLVPPAIQIEHSNTGNYG